MEIVLRKEKQIHQILTFFITAVWLINGLVCKVLNFVPRHQDIVSRILGTTYSQVLTLLIGFSEITIAIWIISKFKTRLNTIIQIVIVATMNLLEFILAPDLLLWGKLNSLFAFLFIVILYFNEFILNKKLTH